MVSKARLDLPEPESPVITISASRGSSTSMPLRLCSRAPEMTMRSEGGIAAQVYGGERLFPSASAAHSDDLLGVVVAAAVIEFPDRPVEDREMGVEQQVALDPRDPDLRDLALPRRQRRHVAGEG